MNEENIIAFLSKELYVKSLQIQEYPKIGSMDMSEVVFSRSGQK